MVKTFVQIDWLTRNMTKNVLSGVAETRSSVFIMVRARVHCYGNYELILFTLPIYRFILLSINQSKTFACYLQQILWVTINEVLEIKRKSPFIFLKRDNILRSIKACSLWGLILYQVIALNFFKTGNLFHLIKFKFKI